MNCKDCLHQISDYLEGELDEGLKKSLEEHLVFCHKCQVVVDSTRTTIELYCDGKLFRLPGEVRDRLHAALRLRLQARNR